MCPTEISKSKVKTFLKFVDEIYDIKDNQEFKDIEWILDFEYPYLDIIEDKKCGNKSLFKITYKHKRSAEENIEFVLLKRKPDQLRDKDYCRYIGCECKQKKLRPIDKEFNGRPYHKCCWFDYVKYDSRDEETLTNYKNKQFNLHHNIKIKWNDYKNSDIH